MKLNPILLLIVLAALVACNSEAATVAPTATDQPSESTEESAETDDPATPTPEATEEAAPMTESAPTDPPPTAGTGTPNADVEYVRAVLGGDGTWTFYVTVRHPDTGWEDYADGWDVVLPDGTVVLPNDADPFTRLLLHPHETEQPFTRSQRGIVIPDGVTGVTVRAHDLVDGFGGAEITVDLTQESGDGYEVERP